jgi:hypothetical protein
MTKRKAPPHFEWTAPRTKLVLELRACAATYQEMAAELGCTYNQMKVKMHQLLADGKLDKGVVEVQQKDCLQCRKPFVSHSRNIFICSPCKASPVFRTGNDFSGSVLR